MSAAAGSLVPLSEAQRAAFAWLEKPHLKTVVAALDRAAPGGARFVGGCVRDALLGEAPKDFDIATTLTPAETIAAVKAAGLRAAPTGIDHGTVTVIVDHQGVEVTTLRADVSTDGRRASVAFTDDWAVDAARRDFTVNAIYLTPDGFLFDPENGLGDIESRTVRFIGDAEQRIREDYLRILRFFRFSARFAPTFDKVGLAAATKLKDGVSILSAERIGAEFMAILSLPRAVFALDGMAQTGVLTKIWPSPARIDAVGRLKELAPQAAPPVVLAALFGTAGDGVGGALRLSNAEKAMRAAALRGAAAVTPGLEEKSVRVLIYELGRDVFFDAVAVAAATGAIDADEFSRLSALGDGWTPPTQPLSGKDVVAFGVRPGAEVAEILAAAEAAWIAEDFPPEPRPSAILAEIIANR